MRGVLVILVLATSVHADRDDDALATEVFRVQGAARARVLDALVARKRLDARQRATFPTREVATRALAKIPIARTGTQRPLDPMSCALTAGGRDLVLQCGERGCAGACQVIRHEATIRVRNGTWSVIGTTVKHLGDTGECGCCM